ncbi:MAG TPA: TetR/AcrR family transcriptional regulator [Solirubrobacterales bacterium]|nr:TetR/AcrR family transcriptional regulator [Solirubrobacterales bacterium]
MTRKSTEQRREGVKARLRQALRAQLPARRFQELRVEDIAEEAGLSRSSFYFYYPDKQSLLMEAAVDIADQLFERADRWWHGEGDPAALVSEGLRGVADLWDRNGDLIVCTFEVATYDERLYAFFTGLVDRFTEETAALIEREQKAGRIDPELEAAGTAAVLVWGLERGLYVTSRGGKPGREELVRATAGVWMRVLYGNGSVPGG